MARKQYYNPLGRISMSEETANSPIVREGDATYLQYDELQVRSGAVDLMWQGKVMYTMVVPLEVTSDPVVLRGIGGRMECTFSDR